MVGHSDRMRPCAETEASLEFPLGVAVFTGALLRFPFLKALLLAFGSASRYTDSVITFADTPLDRGEAPNNVKITKIGTTLTHCRRKLQRQNFLTGNGASTLTRTV
jgi:hypothetical protein